MQSSLESNELIYVVLVIGKVLDFGYYTHFFQHEIESIWPVWKS